MQHRGLYAVICSTERQSVTSRAGGDPLVRLENVRKEYRVGDRSVVAIDGVTLDIYPGETLGLVGESGSGKTTLARVLVGLVKLSSGRIWFDGNELGELSSAEWRRFRRNIQMVFQDPFTSLNPRMTVEEMLSRPLHIHGLTTKQQWRQHVSELLERVGLRPEQAHRYPHELSGGQQQRVGIARALAVKPRLTILDEPTSALDVSVQAQILSLLRRLQEELELTFLFISHDLNVIQYLSHRIAVLYRGQVMEVGDTLTLVSQPCHPYTRFLLGSVPRFYGVGPLLPPSPLPTEPGPVGCCYYSRCSYRSEVCRTRRPDIVPLSPVHHLACFHPWQDSRKVTKGIVDGAE